MLETLLFLALGSFETSGSKLSHGTSSKFADVRTHLRKVSKKTLSLIKKTGLLRSFLVPLQERLNFLIIELPTSYDKNQSLNQQGLQLASFRFPNRLQLGRLKPGYQVLSTVGSSALHPQPRHEE